MKTTEIYSVLKVSEGGIGQKGAIDTLRKAGIDCSATYSPYVGYVGILVTGTKRQHKQARSLLF